MEGIDLYISHLKKQHLGYIRALLPRNLFLIIDYGGGGELLRESGNNNEYFFISCV